MVDDIIKACRNPKAGIAICAISFGAVLLLVILSLNELAEYNVNVVSTYFWSSIFFTMFSIAGLKILEWICVIIKDKCKKN